jgi:hypothetical protein
MPAHCAEQKKMFFMLISGDVFKEQINGGKAVEERRSGEAAERYVEAD